jgi:hypothetical protein
MVNSMKKDTPTKNKKTTEDNSPQVDTEAGVVLRTVADQEAFYFYEAVGKPTGKIARNLPDFLDKVKSAKMESLLFHLQRNDFQNWVEKILGDRILADKLGRIASSKSGDVRMNICKTVENRIVELRESSLATLVRQNPALLLHPQ